MDSSNLQFNVITDVSFEDEVVPLYAGETGATGKAHSWATAASLSSWFLPPSCQPQPSAPL
jgi:hypothetical protein